MADLRNTAWALKRVARFFAAAGLGALLVLATASQSSAQSRIKDIADFEGVRDNMLVGYGDLTEFLNQAE